MELFRNLTEEEKIQKLVEAVYWLAKIMAELDYDIRAIKDAMANEGKIPDYSRLSLSEFKEKIQGHISKDILGLPFIR